MVMVKLGHENPDYKKTTDQGLVDAIVNTLSPQLKVAKERGERGPYVLIRWAGKYISLEPFVVTKKYGRERREDEEGRVINFPPRKEFYEAGLRVYVEDSLDNELQVLELAPDLKNPDEMMRVLKDMAQKAKASGVSNLESRIKGALRRFFEKPRIVENGYGLVFVSEVKNTPKTSRSLQTFRKAFYDFLVRPVLKELLVR